MEIIMLSLLSFILFFPFITTYAKHMPLYVFGDSLYDTGTALYVDKGPAADSYPYGETFFKKPAGRFSDGRLIPDFIALYANLSLPEPYSNPKLDYYNEAVNFADAAAGVLVETRPNTLNLRLQVENFLEMVKKMQQKYGEEETKKLVSRAAYLFNIGGNDYVDLYNFNTKPLSSSLINQRIKDVLGNFSTHITTIFNKGGRKFAFHSLAPMGCLPAYLQPNGECTKELNEIALMHNDGFKALARSLARKLPKFKYSIYNFYTSLNTRLSNGLAYGFQESKSACCGSGPFRGQFTCMDKANFTLCSDPTQYLWFDAGHPTEKADQQFALEFWSGSSNFVTPRNIMSFYKNH